MILAPGQVHDLNSARALLAALPMQGCLIADKAYDARDLRERLSASASAVVIPPKANIWHKLAAYDPVLYKQLNLIECAFNRLKNWRAIATRYDKKAQKFFAGVCLAATLIWWVK